MPDTHDNGRNPFLKEIAPWIQGRNISLYLTGRDKPITGVTVKHCGQHSLVGRWNNSTHIIPAARIAFIRYSPDADPCRDIRHPLNATVNNRSHVTPTPAANQQRTPAPCQPSCLNQQATEHSGTAALAAIMPRVIAANASALAHSTAGNPSPTHKSGSV